MGVYNKYTQEENDFIRANYMLYNPSQIGEFLNRPKDSIRQQCLRLGLKQRGRYDLLWDEEKLKLLTDNAHNTNIASLAKIISLPKRVITKKMKELQINPFVKKENWTIKEVNLLIELWRGGANRWQMAEKLNRSSRSILSKISKIGNKPKRDKNGKAALFFNL